MQRIEPTFGEINLTEDPIAAAGARIALKSRRLYKSLLGWLAVLFVFLALVVAGGGYAVHSGLLPYAAQVGHAELIYPLAAICVFAALAVTYGRWFGLTTAACAALAVAVYLLLFSPHYGGGLFFAAFNFTLVCYAFVVWRRST
jgi:hypothetical protein